MTIVRNGGKYMLTFLGIIMFITIILAIGSIVAAVALPIFIVVFAVGLVIAIIGVVFKLVFGGAAIILLIVLALIYFSKHKKRY